MKTDELKNLDFCFSLLEKFNKEKFPVRANSFNDYYKYRFIDNPFCEYPHDTIYSTIENSNYIAQMMTMPAPLSFNGESIPAYWGQDYFVDEKYQGKGIGKEMTRFFLGKNYYIAVGFSKISSIVHKKGGCRCIGFLDFYEKWKSPFAKLYFYIYRLLKFKNKPLEEYVFPEEIKGWKRFHSTDEISLPQKNWNKDTVETLRDKTYMKWRFFYLPNRYFCYQLPNKNPNENPSYFVCKVYFYKGVHWLRIVDYRFQKENTIDFTNILETAHLLVEKLGLFGVLISSSLKISNEILDQQNFTKTAHKEVLTMYPFAHEAVEENDEMHNHFMISFADNDTDMHTNKGQFNYGKDY